MSIIKEENFEFFKIVKKGKYEIEGKVTKDKYAKKVYTAYKKLDKTRNKLRRESKEETIIGSYMGRAGQFIEPFTRWAGLNWQINIALMSSFAAKESSVATLGGIYQSPPGDKDKVLEERMREKEVGWTGLHVLAIMIFMAMYPPCIPTLLMIRLETGSTKWMLFATNKEYKESAWFVGVAFQAADPLEIAARYEAFDDDIPGDQDGHLNDRYSIGFTYRLFDKDSFAANLMGEYRVSTFEIEAGNPNGVDDKVNEAFARLAIEF